MALRGRPVESPGLWGPPCKPGSSQSGQQPLSRESQGYHLQLCSSLLAVIRVEFERATERATSFPLLVREQM